MHCKTVAGKRKCGRREMRKQLLTHLEIQLVLNRGILESYYVLVVCIRPIPLYPSWDSSHTMKSRR